MLLVVLSAALLGTPASWIERALTVPAGAVEARLDVNLTADDPFGVWAGTVLHGAVGLGGRLQLGGRALLIAYEPSSPCACNTFGGVVAEARLRVVDALALRGEVGFVRPDGIVFLPFLPPTYEHKLATSLGVGLAFKQRLGDRLAVTFDPLVVVQGGNRALESGFGDVYTFLAPVAVHFQATPRLVAHVESGAFGIKSTGGGGTFGHAIPLVAGARYTLAGDRVDLGARIGLSHVEALDPGNTLYVGLAATWRVR
jgi:hypothetical protein